VVGWTRVDHVVGVREKRRQQLGSRAARQAHGKDRPFARLARHRHVATHHTAELSGDSEPEPGAAEALRG
jgi:hypothetical protein